MISYQFKIFDVNCHININLPIIIVMIADAEVYNIYAEISFNPKTNMLFDLRWAQCHRHLCHHHHHRWHHYHPYDHDSCSMWTGREQCARVDSHMDLFNLSQGKFVFLVSGIGTCPTFHMSQMVFGIHTKYFGFPMFIISWKGKPSSRR